MLVPLVAQANNAVNFASETRLVATTITVVARVSSFILQHFNEIKHSGNFLFGSKDIFKGARVAADQWHYLRANPRVERAFWGIMGGATVVVGAGCSLMGSNLKGFSTSWDFTLFQVGDGFFILASLIRLRNGIADFYFAEAIGDHFGMKNAIIGVIGSLSALLASILVLCSCPMTFWVFFCFLGASLSVIQFLHNLVHGKYHINYFNQVSFQVI